MNRQSNVTYMLVAIFVVISVSLSLSNCHQLRSTSQNILSAPLTTSPKSAIEGQHVATRTIDESLELTTEGSTTRLHSRLLKRKDQHKEESSTSLLPSSGGGASAETKNHVDSDSKSEKKKNNSDDDRSDDSEPSLEPKTWKGSHATKPPPQGKGKASSKASKGSEKKRRKKESKDPKKKQSKLKTAKRHVSTPTQIPAPTPSPTVGLKAAMVRVPEFTISYSAPQAETEPSSAEYNAITARTSDFYNTYLSNYFRGTINTFESMNVMNINRRFRNDSTTDDNDPFNIRMDFNATIFYSQARNPLSAQQHFEILRDAISPKYILDFVRPVGGAFGRVNKVVLGPIVAQ